MLTFVVVLSALNASDTLDQITSTRGKHSWDLEWTDAEDRLYGFVTPLDPVEGRPVEISLRVGTYQGTDLDGPLTVTMRCLDWSEAVTVPRAKDSKAYLATFTPQGNGECRIDVGWQTTRRKVAHTSVSVATAPISRAPWYALVGVLAAIALGFGIRAALKRAD